MTQSSFFFGVAFSVVLKSATAGQAEKWSTITAGLSAQMDGL